MQWSNKGGSAGQSPKIKAVLPKDVADKTVLEFVPARFDLGTPKQALQYLAEKTKGSDFRMNDAVRVQTGIDQVEQNTEEEKVEEAALEKLKEIQEGAYEEAYKLGLEEGRKEAFDKVSAQIAESMQSMDTLLNGIKDIKSEMATFNEAHLIKLVFQMAARLAKTELEGNNEAMVKILKDAVSLSQDEENITVRVSQKQFEFLEELKKESGREFEFIKRIRFEPSAEVSDGGCIVETNYGEVDARIEQRVEQLWSVLSENIPKVKDKAAS
ncbi:flagellar assembly protein [Bdellovibrio bacteriovorus]|uniref:Flagellar assembly protein FliH n=1 Tax=Bdellovibrio bacteriovorus TaxID=959 RepID=A0A150WNW7_BDEBC|nr:FliH/SctL family protein [Bdellovibrio bacteriovorus]KYG66203.1 flagellar assembly protein [Bdellovibrio bacteriovorus]